MTTMNISLPVELKHFIDGRVQVGGYTSTSEYVRELVRRDQDRHRLRTALLEGASTPSAGLADAPYFEGLRARVRSDDPAR